MRAIETLPGPTPPGDRLPVSDQSARPDHPVARPARCQPAALTALGALVLLLAALTAPIGADLSALEVHGVALAIVPDDQGQPNSERAVPRVPGVALAIAAGARAEPRSERAESLAERLLEDETLRRRLSDDEYLLVLEWAFVKVDQTAERCGPAGAGRAECFHRSSDQLVELLRLVDLTVGERTLVAPGVLLERLRSIEAAVEPPLFERQASLDSRARLEALRAEAGAWSQAADSLALLRRVVDALQ